MLELEDVDCAIFVLEGWVFCCIVLFWTVDFFSTGLSTTFCSVFWGIDCFFSRGFCSSIFWESWFLLFVIGTSSCTEIWVYFFGFETGITANKTKWNKGKKKEKRSFDDLFNEKGAIK